MSEDEPLIQIGELAAAVGVSGFGIRHRLRR
jgi:hypothetical protein